MKLAISGDKKLGVGVKGWIGATGCVVGGIVMLGRFILGMGITGIVTLA